MKKPSLANTIIVFCVAVSLFITVAVVYEYHRLNTVMTSGVVSALMGLWGGGAVNHCAKADIRLGRHSKVQIQH